MNKYKILNDPVHGFLTIPEHIVQELIEHGFFQRLRRIKQMGMAHYVYPGAVHTRFHHALGAMHLMQKAIQVLRAKGIEINNEEEESSLAAILLHDVGHGPFSHALEHVLIENVDHEFFSQKIIAVLNEELNGKLSMALEIFNGNYEKQFLHQLVSSQLDVDRLDYLARDSFFTGVYEGRISTERIISMLNVVDNRIVVEAKGLYSIEKYLVSRRLMYWQVYLHKTAVAAEQMLVGIIKRAREIFPQVKGSTGSNALEYFLENNVTQANFLTDNTLLEKYLALDDIDIMHALKVWQHHKDKIMSYLSSSILNRKLFAIKMQKEDFKPGKIEKLQEQMATISGLEKGEIDYLIVNDKVSNLAYQPLEKNIGILKKNGKVRDILSISDQLSKATIGKIVNKNYLCYPKDFYELRS